MADTMASLRPSSGPRTQYPKGTRRLSPWEGGPKIDSSCLLRTRPGSTSSAIDNGDDAARAPDRSARRADEEGPERPVANSTRGCEPSPGPSGRLDKGDLADEETEKLPERVLALLFPPAIGTPSSGLVLRAEGERETTLLPYFDLEEERTGARRSTPDSGERPVGSLAAQLFPTSGDASATRRQNGRPDCTHLPSTRAYAYFYSFPDFLFSLFVFFTVLKD